MLRTYEQKVRDILKAVLAMDDDQLGHLERLIESELSQKDKNELDQEAILSD